jgi:hypothetical protein
MVIMKIISVLTGDALQVYDYRSGFISKFNTGMFLQDLFRDVSAWYHMRSSSMIHSVSRS